MNTWIHRLLVRSCNYFRGVALSLSLGLLALISSCSSVELETYADNQPKMDVETFFSGRLTAHGIVKNRGGEVIRYFNATIDASWNEDGIGTLDERFIFDDGEQQTRVWTLVPDDDVYIATAGDVVGSSNLRSAGNALFLNYVLQIPYKDSTLNLAVDDRMYLVNDTTLINETIMAKWGFEVGYVTLVIIKR
ncbi:DUF3833 domain-containing protein [Teredinibacter waterburyi]|uniref:DUF3833 domain-containing protein n=1 Tax=Teredinibacter waterburyi TaxID=1500538 RepID=UPI00165F21E6|nr:DUF3833 domain-containing protein [Teredinibacter waterburyi]